VGSRNRQRATFEKRQREMAKKERQAEKRARRQGRLEPEERSTPPAFMPTGFPIGEYPHERSSTPPPVDEDSTTSESESESESPVSGST
jgi:hypothetical protein